MNISYNWLRSYIDCDLTPHNISEILTEIGLEVEGFEKIESIKGGLAGVVTAEVLTCTPHPDSDHLNITTVDVGADTPLQIVCGAANCRAGLKVICATVGTTLYPADGEGEFKIKKSKIRGVESFGMLCAEDEIGIGTGHEGIMELPAETPVGQSAKEYFNIEDDYLFEIGLTPNRIDAASHYGVARDLAAYLQSRGLKCTLSLPSVEEFKPDNHNLNIEVEVVSSELAPRYAGVTVTGCKLAPSPDWMQARLRAVGVNPKNNLVDITNYVLFELGQPLHAFDARKIEGGAIVVRPAQEGEKFTTLDGVERTLTASDLMICSKQKAMCLAGVYGGLDSGVSDQTVDIFIESAYFNPVSIRKSAKRFGLNTEASFRFERGIDPNIQIYAAKRAALLFKELAGGEISSDVSDLYPSPIEDFRFELSCDRARSLIGKQISDEEIKRIITALDIKIESEEGSTLRVAVPPYRVDVQREADVIEDILRIYGYNNIEVSSHVKSTISHPARPDSARLMNLTADLLTANGYTEIMSNSLSKGAYYEAISDYSIEECVKILNPLSSDLNVMRQTLLFNSLEAIELNVNRRQGDIKIYEFGNVYSLNSEADTSCDALAKYNESYHMAIAVSGAERVQSWNQSCEPSTFFTLRGGVERVLRRFGIDLYSLKSEAITNSDLYSEGLIFSLNGKELLRMGVISTKARKAFDIKQDIYYAEVNFDALVKSTRRHKIAVQELSKYPEVRRDLALLVDKSISFAELRAVAISADKKLLKSVTLFDVYDGDKLPAGKKSYALGFTLEDKTQTLNDKTIEKAMSNIQRQLETKCGAQIR